MDQAFDALEKGDFSHALQIGDELIRLRYTGGYEVKARALHGTNQQDQALKVLRQGLQAAPDNYVLCGLLTEYEAATGNYQAAFAAFHEYVQAGGDKFWAYSNIALLYGAADDPLTGLQFLEGISPNSDEEHESLFQTRAALLGQASRFSELSSYSEEHLNRFPHSASALGHLAVCKFEEGKLDQARECALKSIALEKTDAMAAQVLQRLHGSTSPDAKFWRLTVHGAKRIEDEKGRLRPLDFLATYFVKARTPEEGLEFCRSFEQDTLVPLTLEQIKSQKEVPDGPDGVYRAHRGYIFMDSSD